MLHSPPDRTKRTHRNHQSVRKSLELEVAASVLGQVWVLASELETGQVWVLAMGLGLA